MPEITDTINRIQTITSGITGIRSAPNTTPETEWQFPFIATYPSTGTVERVGLYLEEHHTFALEIHVSRVDLARDITEILPYLRLVTNALWADPTLNSTIEHFELLNYTFGPAQWGIVDTIAFRLQFTTKQSTPLTSPVDISSGADAPTLLEAMTAIQAIMPTVVRDSPATPTEATVMFPVSVCYPATGSILKSFDWTKELHTFSAEIHIARTDLGRDSAIAYTTLRDFLDALYNDPTLGYAVSTTRRQNHNRGS